MGKTMNKEIILNHSYCKGCGICVVLCPKSILKLNEDNKISVTDSNECIGCRQCEFHCPDFAIIIGEDNG